MSGGGDEVGALVFDVGTGSTRVGYAGDDQPRCVMPTFTAQVQDAHYNAEQHKRKRTFGSSAFGFKRDYVDVLQPFNTQGLVADWDQYEELLSHVATREMMVDLKEHPLLMSEPTLNEPKLRERLTQLCFEKFGAPALFLSKTAVLSCFSVGKSSGLVVDCGATSTVVTPVVEGYAMQKASERMPVGGEHLTQFLYDLLSAKDVNVTPRYAVPRGPRAGSAVDVSHVTASYAKFHVMDVVRDMKEEVCLCSPQKFDESGLASLPRQSFELPDKTSIELGPERYKVPEVMFAPQLLERDDLGADKSLPTLVYSAVQKSNPDVRKDMLNNVLVVGGGSLMRHFSERLKAELEPLTGTIKVRMVLSTSVERTDRQLQQNAERRNAAWIGGSILGSLGTFHQMWISKQEYDEYGAGIVGRKCP